MRVWMLCLAGCARVFPFLADDEPKQVEHGGFTAQGATNTCTIGTNLEPRCMEVIGFPSSAPKFTRSEDYRRKIIECYRNVANGIQASRDAIYWGPFEKIVELSDLALTSPGLAGDPGFLDCVAIADRFTKGAFSYNLALDRELTRIGRTFEDDFRAACNEIGFLFHDGKLGGSFHVDVPNKPKKPNATVAMSADHPHYEVLCTGEFRLTGLDGKVESIEPTHSDDRRAKAHEGCLLICRDDPQNAGACSRHGLDDKGCRNLCEYTCEKQKL